MCSQLFKNSVPTELFTTLIELNCAKYTNYYLFNNASFKKGILNESIEAFINNIKQYYHQSKQKYLPKKCSYNMFTTIIRQICKHHNIVFTTQILYDKSKYEIIYYIFIT
jgi:sulfatase maturation enzyme AslB (radical SAM superfamily)